MLKSFRPANSLVQFRVFKSRLNPPQLFSLRMASMASDAPSQQPIEKGGPQPEGQTGELSKNAG